MVAVEVELGFGVASEGVRRDGLVEGVELFGIGGGGGEVREVVAELEGRGGVGGAAAEEEEGVAGAPGCGGEAPGREQYARQQRQIRQRYLMPCTSVSTYITPRTREGLALAELLCDFTPGGFCGVEMA